jgi:single-strand DNA-binding protein
MSSYNKIILVGRLGRDPEGKALADGKRLVKFSLATDSGYGENKTTDWHNCTCFGKTAEQVEAYCKKGKMVLVEGSVHYRKVEERYFTDITVDRVQFLDGGKAEPAATPAASVKAEDMPF